MYRWFMVLFAFMVAFVFQNCSPAFKTTELESLLPKNTQMTSETDSEKEALLLSESSLTNQNSCINSNSVTITMQRSVYDNYICLDGSKLSSRVTKGPLCTGGAYISDFSVSTKPGKCQELTLCGVPSKSKNVYAKIVTFTFDNLPWGCDGKIQVIKPDQEGRLDTVVKNLNLYIQPPSCRFCNTTRTDTCGDCADPGCKDSETGAFYSIGQSKRDLCPHGQTGAEGLTTCIASNSWSTVATKQCNLIKCIYDGVNYDIGSVRTKPCEAGIEGNSYSCGPDGKWIIGEKIDCPQLSPTTKCNFDDKAFMAGEFRTTPCSVGVSGGNFRCETNGSWTQIDVINCPVAGEPSCPEGYVKVPVPGSEKRFCVAKYEMKIDNPNNFDPAYNNVYKNTDRPISKPQTRPWTNITRNNAIEACKNLGSNYDLISNNQWQLIAKDIASNKVNWMTANAAGRFSASTAITQGQVNQGNAFSSASTNPNSALAQKENYATLFPASVEDTKYVCGNLSECGINDFYKKRTHHLSNGNTVWDFSGNAWEWVKDDTPAGLTNDVFLWIINLPSSNTIAYPLYSNGEALACASAPTPSNRNCGYGFFLTPATGVGVSTNKGILRGGRSVFMTRSGSTYSTGGIFTTSVSNPDTLAGFSAGFRCVYRLD